MGNKINPVGRPKKGNEKRSCYGASLEPSTAEQAKQIFGSVGKAVEWAVNEHIRYNNHNIKVTG